MTVRIKLIEGYTVNPVYKNVLNSIAGPRDKLEYEYALNKIFKDSGAEFVIQGDVWAEFEEEKNLTMFILRWS